MINVNKSQFMPKMPIWWDNGLITAFSPLTRPEMTLRHPDLNTYYRDTGGFPRQKQIQTYILQGLVDAINAFGNIMLLYFELKGDYGNAGEARLKLSHIRNLYRIPPHLEVTQNDVDSLNNTLKILLAALDNPDVQKLKRCMKNFSIAFPFGVIALHAPKKIQRLLQFIGADNIHYHIKGKSGDDAILLAYAKEFDIHLVFPQGIQVNASFEKKIIITEDELSRTPNYVGSLAGSSYDDFWLIRRETVLGLYFNKWHSYFTDSEFLKELWDSHQYSNLREAFKRVTLNKYQATNLEELENQRNLFLNDIVEGIVVHEIAHSIREHLMPDHFIAVASSTSDSYATHAVKALSEVLTDWVPEYHGMRGPILHIAYLSRSDRSKAERMLYSMFSDYWFYDFGESEFGVMSDCWFPPILQFINADLTVDFERLIAEHAGIFNFMNDLYMEAAATIEEIYLNATYTVAGYELTFTALVKHILKVVRQENEELAGFPDRVLRGYWSFYRNIYFFLEKYATDDFKKLQVFLVQFTEKTACEMRRNFFPADSGSDGILAAILDRCKQLGLYNFNLETAKMTELPHQLRSVYTSELLGRLDSHIDSWTEDNPSRNSLYVFRFFRDILVAGNTYSLKISYKKTRVVNRFLQYLLGEYRPLEQAHKLDFDEHFDPYKESSIDYVTKIFRMLSQNIQLGYVKFYKSITIDNSFVRPRDMREALRRFEPYDKGLLRRRTIRFGLDSIYDLEIEIPARIMPRLEPGFICWQTAQAVYRINHLLLDRPEREFWLLDQQCVAKLLQIINQKEEV